MKYGEWIEAWTIMMNHAKPSPGAPDVTNPPDIYAFSAAEHDIFYFPLSSEDIPEDSEDGQRLLDLGLMVSENESWAVFT